MIKNHSEAAIHGVHLLSGWLRLQLQEWADLCLHAPSSSSGGWHIYHLTRLREKSSQKAPFGLWEPISHTKILFEN